MSVVSGLVTAGTMLVGSGLAGYFQTRSHDRQLAAQQARHDKQVQSAAGKVDGLLLCDLPQDVRRALLEIAGALRAEPGATVEVATSEVQDDRSDARVGQGTELAPEHAAPEPGTPSSAAVDPQTKAFGTAVGPLTSATPLTGDARPPGTADSTVRETPWMGI